MHVNRIERPKPISSVHKPESRQPPVQRGQPGGASAQREFGVAPQHQGQSSALPAQRKELGPSRQISKPAPPAQSQPQGASPGIPHTGIKEKDER